jgi:hypothetical protein
MGAASLALATAGQAQAASTQPPDLPDVTAAAPVPDQIGVGGTVGLARGQLARLTFHARHIIGEIPPDPIDVALRIRDLTGAVLAEQIFRNVAANHGGSVDFHHLAAVLTRSALADRIQLIGEVEHTVGYTIGATLEIIAPNTGQTVLDIQPCIIPAPTPA